MGFSKQEDWSELSFPSPGDFPDPGTEQRLLYCQADSLSSESPGNIIITYGINYFIFAIEDTLQHQIKNHILMYGKNQYNIVKQLSSS